MGQTVGPAHAWLSLTEEATDSDRWPVTVRGVDIGRLDVKRIDRDRAVVEVSAQRHYILQDPRGRPRNSQTVVYDGPVHLRNIDGNWRVDDCIVDGRMVSDALRLSPGGSQESAGVTVEVAAAFLSGHGSHVVIRIENGRAGPLRVSLAALRIGSRWRGAVIQKYEVLSATTTLVGIQARARLAEDASHVVVALVLMDDVTKERLPFTFPVDLTSTSHQPPARVPLRAQLEGRWPNGIRFLIIAAPAAALLAWGGLWDWIGLLALAYGALIAVYYGRRRHHLGASWWLVTGAALIVLGILVLALTGWGVELN